MFGESTERSDLSARSYVGTPMWLGLVESVTEECDVICYVEKNLISGCCKVLQFFLEDNEWQNIQGLTTNRMKS